jgi:hypothetical protein
MVLGRTIELKVVGEISMGGREDSSGTDEEVMD